MKAMVLRAPGAALALDTIDVPKPDDGQLLLQVRACGVCRTDLHVIDGELERPKLPLVLGHQIVGVTLDGRRFGVPWLGSTCGVCRLCLSGLENLCDQARFTGYDIDGGYAEWVVADEGYCFPLPDSYDDLQAAPLLCAGLIGYRSLRLAGDPERVGLAGDDEAQAFARSLGVEWAGSEQPPEELDAAIIFAPAGELVPAALRAVAKGGSVVCAGIHTSDIPTFPYKILWGERVLRSVANLTRRDGQEFLELAPRVPVHTHVESFSLERADDALAKLRAGDVRGALVLVP